eukprot:6436-Heterococcus_DN1.PRE.4
MEDAMTMSCAVRSKWRSKLERFATRESEKAVDRHIRRFAFWISLSQHPHCQRPSHTSQQTADCLEQRLEALRLQIRAANNRSGRCAEKPLAAALVHLSQKQPVPVIAGFKRRYKAFPVSAALHGALQLSLPDPHTSFYGAGIQFSSLSLCPKCAAGATQGSHWQCGTNTSVDTAINLVVLRWRHTPMASTCTSSSLPEQVLRQQAQPTHKR